MNSSDARKKTTPEQELISARREIEQLKVALELQRKQLKQNLKLESLGEMAATIVHEIKNPLCAMILTASGLRAKLEKKEIDPVLLKTQLKKIEENGERITNIIQSIKGYASEGFELSPEKVDMKKIVSEVCANYRERFEKEKVAFTLTLPTENAWVSGRAIQLGQIVTNLFENALDACEGSAELWIKAELIYKEGKLFFRVWDSGLGVSTEIEKLIFKPFYTTKAPSNGTGLGLSISSTIALAHGGSIELDRKISASCFCLCIPLC